MTEAVDIKYFTLAIGSQSIKRTTDMDISARCPHCSSDDRWKHTSRLHLYTKNGITNVNCFTGDCSVKNKNVYSFLRDFHPSLLDNYKRETFTNRMDDLSTNNDESGNDVFSNIKKKKVEPTIEGIIKDEIVNEIENALEVVKPVNTFDLSPYFDLLSKKITPQTYIEGRGFNAVELQEKFGVWYYGKGDLEIDDKKYPLGKCVIIPLYYNDEMYGFYSRNIEKKDFWTFNQDINIGYKVWNWFNIDFTKPVYIFEGIFDAISFAVSSGNYNVIATMGAQLNNDRIRELSDPIFVLDNDRSGFTNGLKYTRDGHKVYIQPTNIIEKDMNMMYLNGLDCGNIVQSNIFHGIFAEIELKTRL